MKGRFEIASCSSRAPVALGRGTELPDLARSDRGPWEVELGFGKGRYLLERAASAPERSFLGIERAGEYFRLVLGRLQKRGLDNVVLIRGEALAFLATEAPRRFAAAIHVYFPDPWPKSRHERRRLFSPAAVDVLLSALAPGGRLYFATDHPAYGAAVRRILSGFPGASVRELVDGWPDGPRTNYEAKYLREGRPIVRLEVGLASAALLHPQQDWGHTPQQGWAHCPEALRELLVASSRIEAES